MRRRSGYRINRPVRYRTKLVGVVLATSTIGIVSAAPALATIHPGSLSYFYSARGVYHENQASINDEVAYKVRVYNLIQTPGVLSQSYYLREDARVIKAGTLCGSTGWIYNTTAVYGMSIQKQSWCGSTIDGYTSKGITGGWDGGAGYNDYYTAETTPPIIF